MTDSSSTEMSEGVLTTTEPKSTENLATTQDVVKPPEQAEYLEGIRLLTIVISMMLAVFCVALDNTIIATAIPRMTDTFKKVDDIGWYGAAYLLTTCSFQLLYVKFFRTFNAKWVFLIALFIFEVGSAICGAAPSSTVFIVGRAIAGLGAAGIFTGATTITAVVAPLRLRPIIAGLIGGLFGMCSIFGPLLGGVFTSKATWRWCFYINLPIGALTAIGVGFLLHIRQTFTQVSGTPRQIFFHFDPIGNTFFISSIICLLLALHWGESTYPYSNGRIIALFVLFGLLLIGFIVVQVLRSEEATVPPRVAKQRSIQFVLLFAFSLGGTIYPIVYYLAVWFQVVKDLTPILSAVHTLPMILSQLCGNVVAGILTSKIGYYVPFIYASSILMPLGAGLLTTTSVNISLAKSFGYQILLGFGFGFGFQQGAVTCQTVLAAADTPIGTSVTFSAQLLGGAIFLSVAQNLFTTHLAQAISALNIPGVSGKILAQTGATDIRSVVPAEYLDAVLVAYNNSIVKTYQLAMIMSCLAVLGAIGVEWRSVLATPKQENATAKSETSA